jgi:hypothetical protein
MPLVIQQVSIGVKPFNLPADTKLALLPVSGSGISCPPFSSNGEFADTRPFRETSVHVGRPPFGNSRAVPPCANFCAGAGFVFRR